MNFRETDEFGKNLRRLSKKYKSLPEDLALFKLLLSKEPLGLGRHFAVLHKLPGFSIIKARLACKYLKNSSSSLRVIYAYHADTNQIELIEFIELYFKGEKVREDEQRIQDYIKRYMGE